MRDEEGYLEGGDLGSGGYGALEGDLGETLRPLAGFGRDIEPPGRPQEGLWDDEEEGTYVLPGGFSTGLPAGYTLKGWNAYS